MKAINAHQLTKEFRNVTAVNSISFSVDPGEIFGFLGPNGAGKTTTIRMLTAQLLPTSGSASWIDLALYAAVNSGRVAMEGKKRSPAQPWLSEEYGS